MDGNRRRDLALRVVIALLVVVSAVFVVLGVLLITGDSSGQTMNGAKYVQAVQADERAKQG